MRNTMILPRSHVIRAITLAAFAAGGLLLGIANPHHTDGASATLSIDPPVQAVGSGSKFEVRVIQRADVATLGAQVSINFDPSIVRILGLGVGTGYNGTQLISAGPIADVVATANS